jgi:tetratricopeptide (TPR) repeat protein
MGDINFELGNISQSINFYTQQLNLSEGKRDTPSSVSSLVKISRCYYAMGDYPTSSRYLNRALALARASNLTESKADVYRYLALIYETQGRYKDALDFYKMWIELRDSIYSEETGQKLAKLQILYDITQKEKENEILRQNSEIQKLQIAKSKYQGIILLSLAIAFIVLSLFLIMIFRAKQKEFKKQKETEQRITEINKELEKRMIQEIKKQEKQQQLLSQKSKLESLGTLAAGIAHEINHPLVEYRWGSITSCLKRRKKHDQRVPER